MITKEQALTLNEFWLEITNPRHKRFGQRARFRRNGKTQTWKTRPNDFKVPVKYGLYEFDYVTNENANLWFDKENDNASN